MKKILVIACCLIPYVALAEPVTLDQVLQDSLQKNADIARVQREYEDKLAEGIETSTLENPELQADAIRNQGESGTGYDLELTQPLKLSQITGARHRYASYLSDAASTEQRYEILKVINETTMLYVRLWLLQERKSLARGSAEDANAMSKLVKTSTGQGQTSAAASHLFAADAAKLESDVGMIDAELRQVRTDLARMTGRSFIHAELKRPNFSAVPESAEVLVTFAKDRANLRNIIKSRIKAAEERLSIANQDSGFEFGPRLVAARSPDGDEKSYGIGVALRIPLWNQNNAERKRAEANLRQAKTEAEVFANLPVEETISELQQSAAMLQKRADSYFTAILPGYRKSYELTQSMFRQGQADALEVWQVREKLYLTENDALAAVVEAINARGNLELELGGKLEEIGAKD